MGKIKEQVLEQVDKMYGCMFECGDFEKLIEIISKGFDALEKEFKDRYTKDEIVEFLENMYFGTNDEVEQFKTWIKSFRNKNK